LPSTLEQAFDMLASESRNRTPIKSLLIGLLLKENVWGQARNSQFTTRQP